MGVKRRASYFKLGGRETKASLGGYDLEKDSKGLRELAKRVPRGRVL